MGKSSENLQFVLGMKVVDDIPIHLLCHLPLVGLCATHEAPELPCIFGIEQVEVGLNFDLVGLHT